MRYLPFVTVAISLLYQNENLVRTCAFENLLKVNLYAAYILSVEPDEFSWTEYIGHHQHPKSLYQVPFLPPHVPEGNHYSDV